MFKKSADIYISLFHCFKTETKRLIQVAYYTYEKAPLKKELNVFIARSSNKKAGKHKIRV